MQTFGFGGGLRSAFLTLPPSCAPGTGRLNGLTPGLDASAGRPRGPRRRSTPDHLEPRAESRGGKRSVRNNSHSRAISATGAAGGDRSRSPFCRRASSRGLQGLGSASESSRHAGLARQRVRRLMRETNLMSLHRCRRRGGRRWIRTHAPKVLAHLAFGCSPWTTAGAGSSPPSMERRVVSMAPLQARATASPHRPIMRSMWAACRAYGAHHAAERGSGAPLPMDR